MMKNRCADWAATRESTEGCDDFKIYFVEVDFDKLADGKRRKAMKRLPTTFDLPVEQVDDLRAAAREIVTNSRDFQEFMRDMEGHWSPSAKK
jgi:NTE family protein